MLERLACWYLKRRGRVVLPRIFIGFVVGNTVAARIGGDQNYDTWKMHVPKCGKIYAMNNSTVIYDKSTST